MKKRQIEKQLFSTLFLFFSHEHKRLQIAYGRDGFVRDEKICVLRLATHKNINSEIFKLFKVLVKNSIKFKYHL